MLYFLEPLFPGSVALAVLSLTSVLSFLIYKKSRPDNFRPVVFKLERVSEPFGRLVKTQITGFYPQSCDSVNVDGARGSAFLNISTDADAASPSTTL